MTTSNVGTHKLEDRAGNAIAMLTGNYLSYCNNRGSRVEDIAEVLAQCDKVGKWMSSPDCKPSLTMVGGVGRGKTTMLRSMMNVYGMFGKRCRYVNAQKMAQMSLEDDGDFDLLLGNWYEYLMIDDIGTESAVVQKYGNPSMPFVDIVNARYDMNLPLIITSNIKFGKGSEFEARYGERTVDRLTEMANRMTFNGESYRK